MKLYHGSTLIVRNPSLRPGRANADFGKGFYTTSNIEQAVRWANIKKQRENAEKAIVSVYDFDLVLGPVANDKVFTTVNLFESGVLSAEAAILQLKAYKTYDQISFHTDKVINTLKFIEKFKA